MVKPILDIKYVDPTKIDMLSKDEYLFIYFTHKLDMIYMVISNDLNVGLYDGTFYVFDDNGNLNFKVDVKNIDSMFSYRIKGDGDD